VGNLQPAALLDKICIAELQLRSHLNPKNGNGQQHAAAKVGKTDGNGQQHAAAKVGKTVRARIVKSP